MNAAAQTAKEPQAQPAAAPEPTPCVKSALEQFGWLPCTLSLEIPTVKFTVGDLLRLQKGSIAETGSHYAADIPLRANGLLIGWTEFEVIGNRLAVRITELA